MEMYCKISGPSKFLTITPLKFDIYLLDTHFHKYSVPHAILSSEQILTQSSSKFYDLSAILISLSLLKK